MLTCAMVLTKFDQGTVVCVPSQQGASSFLKAVKIAADLCTLLVVVIGAVTAKAYVENGIAVRSEGGQGPSGYWKVFHASSSQNVMTWPIFATLPVNDCGASSQTSWEHVGSQAIDWFLRRDCGLDFKRGSSSPASKLGIRSAVPRLHSIHHGCFSAGNRVVSGKHFACHGKFWAVCLPPVWVIVLSWLLHIDQLANSFGTVGGVSGTSGKVWLQRELVPGIHRPGCK